MTLPDPIVAVHGRRVLVQLLTPCGHTAVLGNGTRREARYFAVAILRGLAVLPPDYTREQQCRLAFDLLEAAHAAKRAPRVANYG